MNNITDFTYLGQMMFSQELKKALEAARQDEARFLSLKEELSPCDACPCRVFSIKKPSLYTREYKQATTRLITGSYFH